MEAIEAKYKKSNLSMLKSALKNNENFLKIIKKKEPILKKLYDRYAEKFEKNRAKKEDRKHKRMVNKLSQKRKKDVQGCLIKKVEPKDYEDCLKNAKDDDAKYSSSILSKDALIDQLLREKVEENKLK